MKRDIDNALIKWKTHPSRVPLLIRGARQVGKSYSIEHFGRTSFENLVIVNFEFDPSLKTAFETLNPIDIIHWLELTLRLKIRPGKTLLFLDEIQECPNAIRALRYFKEKLPELHVIGAGSLLEFALNQAEFRMPVGRVEYLYQKPLSFLEYLDAVNESGLRNYIEHDLDVNKPPPLILHQQLLGLVQNYMCLGGMPAVIVDFLKTGDLQDCQKKHTILLNTLRDDFGKYANYSQEKQHKILRKVFERAPGLVANWFKYTGVDPDLAPRDIRMALDNLYASNLLLPVHASSASGLPLVSTKNEKKFKLLYLDIGLLHKALDLDINQLWLKKIELLNQGALAEQFVGQELIAYAPLENQPALFFWVREQKGSHAEVDYLGVNGGQIFGIEVKASHIGRLKSLHLFMKEKNSSVGVRISTQPLQYNEQILSVPFYAISKLNTFLSSLEPAHMDISHMGRHGDRPLQYF